MSDARLAPSSRKTNQSSVSASASSSPPRSVVSNEVSYRTIRSAPLSFSPKYASRRPLSFGPSPRSTRMRFRTNRAEAAPSSASPSSPSREARHTSPKCPRANGPEAVGTNPPPPRRSSPSTAGSSGAASSGARRRRPETPSARATSRATARRYLAPSPTLRRRRRLRPIPPPRLRPRRPARSRAEARTTLGTRDRTRRRPPPLPRRTDRTTPTRGRRVPPTPKPPTFGSRRPALGDSSRSHPDRRGRRRARRDASAP